MSPRLLILPLCLMLAACSRPVEPSDSDNATGARAGAPIPEKVPAASEVAMPATSVLSGVNLEQPVSLTGTEPFWGIKITPEGITLSRPDTADTRFMPADFVVNGKRATLESGDLTITLTAKACSDGMSDRGYPLTAEVDTGSETLHGCAASTPPEAPKLDDKPKK